MCAEECRVDALLCAKQQDLKRSSTACVRKKTSLNASPYNITVMLSPSKPKLSGFLKSTKTEWLIFSEWREWRFPRAHSFSKTIPLGVVTPRRHAP